MMPLERFNLRLKPELEQRNLTIRVELVTPQLGGGAEARKADNDQWLRSASVRGALRFWWRALFGGSFKSVKLMHEAESAIFGGTSREKERACAGRVAVTVKILGNAQEKSWADYQRLDAERVKRGRSTRPQPIASAQSIAYFPANASTRESQAAANLVSPSAQAEISLCDLSTSRLPQERLSEEQWEQVLESLRAFLLFGGSGSRTRRGAGALCFCDPKVARELGLPITTESIEQWIRKHTQAQYDHACFLLSRCQYVYSTPTTYDSGEQAQEALLAMWREFRQQRRHPPNWSGFDNWGRSRWPEADAIRLITAQHASWDNNGQPIHHSPSPTNRGRAPRAHLGLPIGVKFKDDDAARKRETDKGMFPRGAWIDTDPQGSEIVLSRPGKDDRPEILDRYASPVLLAVTAVLEPGQPTKRRFVGLVLITRSILLPTQTIVLKGNQAQHLHPGEWTEVLDSQPSRYGLLQILAGLNFQSLLKVKGAPR